MREKDIIKYIYPFRIQLLSGVLLVILASLWQFMAGAGNPISWFLPVGFACGFAVGIRRELGNLAVSLQRQTVVTKADMIQILQVVKKAGAKSNLQFVPEAPEAVKMAVRFAELQQRKGLFMVVLAFGADTLFALAMFLVNPWLILGADLLILFLIVSPMERKVLHAGYIPPLQDREGLTAFFRHSR